MSERIEGDLLVGRNIYAGGDLNIPGNATIKRDIKIDGWLIAPNVKTFDLGLYKSDVRLKQAHPNAPEGSFALVGDTLPADVWRVEDGRWVATGEKSSDLSVDLTELQEDMAVSRLINSTGFHIKRTLYGIESIELIGDFRAGTAIMLKADNFINTASEYNVNIHDGIEWFAVAYRSGDVIRTTLPRDTSSLKISSSINITSVDVEVVYGEALANIDAIDMLEQANVSMLEKVNATLAKVDANTAIINTSDVGEIKFSTSAIDNFIYKSTGVYVGYNKPFKKNCVVKSLNFGQFAAMNSVGKSLEVFVGTIDQRGWFLPRATYQVPYASPIDATIVSVDVLAAQITANAGEVLMVKVMPLASDALVSVASETYDANCQLCYTYDLNSSVQYHPTYNLRNYNLEVVYYDSVFATLDQQNTLQAKVNALQSKVAEMNVFKDSSTGEKYRITVVNRDIVLQSVAIKRMLVIGHSFVTYGNSPSADWYLDDGENRAMSPSINAHQWTSLVGNALGASVAIRSGVDFERNHSTSYDFSSKLAVTDSYDAVCVYLSENVSNRTGMQESWEALFAYIKQAAPSARIFCSASWGDVAKATLIQQACENAEVEYVDCMGIYEANNIWKKGDYYLGRGNNYYPMGAAYSHPNDMGHLAIANRFLSAFGEGTINPTHTITLNQSPGGTITTPNSTWLTGGIVTIRLSSNGTISVQTASGASVEATARSNDYLDGSTHYYYTFVMPDEDIIVTPIF